MFEECLREERNSQGKKKNGMEKWAGLGGWNEENIGGKKSPFPHSSVGKESACNAGDPGSIPGLGRAAAEGKGLPTPIFWPGEFHGLYSPRGSQRVGQD